MYSEGNAAEAWFIAQMHLLQMVDSQPPSVQKIKQVLTHYFPGRSERAIRHMHNIEDRTEWLDLIFKVDVLLRLQDLEANSLRVGVDITTNASEAFSKIEMIQSRLFRSARKELDIAQHWVVIISSQTPPSKDRLMDLIYEQVDKGLEWDILNI